MAHVGGDLEKPLIGPGEAVHFQGNLEAEVVISERFQQVMLALGAHGTAAEGSKGSFKAGHRDLALTLGPMRVQTFKEVKKKAAWSN